MKSTCKMVRHHPTMTESSCAKNACRLVALLVAAAFFFAFASCSTESGDGNNDKPNPQTEELTQAQKEAEGTYILGGKTYTVENGKVSVKNEDGSNPEIGEINKEGVITIKQGNTTTTISATKDEDGKVTTKIEIETKDENGNSQKKTYEGDLSTGTLKNPENPNDSIRITKSEPEKTEPANPDTQTPDKPNQDEPDNPNTDTETPEEPENPDNPDPETPEPVPEEPETPDAPENPDTPAPDKPNQDEPSNPGTSDPDSPSPDTPDPKPENPADPENPKPEEPTPANPENPNPEEPNEDGPQEESEDANPEIKVITVTIEPNSAISITKSESESSITLTADEGYTKYSWKIDGKAAESSQVSGDGKILTLTKTDLAENNVYQIALSAYKGNISYGTQITVKK